MTIADLIGPDANPVVLEGDQVIEFAEAIADLKHALKYFEPPAIEDIAAAAQIIGFRQFPPWERGRLIGYAAGRWWLMYAVPREIEIPEFVRRMEEALKA